MHRDQEWDSNLSNVLSNSKQNVSILKMDCFPDRPRRSQMSVSARNPYWRKISCKQNTAGASTGGLRCVVFWQSSCVKKALHIGPVSYPLHFTGHHIFINVYLEKIKSYNELTGCYMLSSVTPILWTISLLLSSLSLSHKFPTGVSLLVRFVLFLSWYLSTPHQLFVIFPLSILQLFRDAVGISHVGWRRHSVFIFRPPGSARLISEDTLSPSISDHHDTIVGNVVDDVVLNAGKGLHNICLLKQKPRGLKCVQRLRQPSLK